MKDKANLPDYTDLIITHYGCSEFAENDSMIYWIGAIYYEDGAKRYFYPAGNEQEIIEQYSDFLKGHDKKIIHWSMITPNYSFDSIKARYSVLTGNSIDLKMTDNIDLSEYLKEKYGIDYIERIGGRLNNLAKLNGFSGIKSGIEVKGKKEAAERLELIFSIYQAEKQGKLKVINTQPPKRKKPTTEEDINNALTKIEPFKGYFNRKPILKTNDFNRLTEYIKSIIIHGKLPDDAKGFPTTGATNQFISKTIHEVYLIIAKQHIDIFISLIKLFDQFRNVEESTIKAKFSIYKADYEKDVKNLITF